MPNVQRGDIEERGDFDEFGRKWVSNAIDKGTFVWGSDLRLREGSMSMCRMVKGKLKKSEIVWGKESVDAKSERQEPLIVMILVYCK